MLLHNMALVHSHKCVRCLPISLIYMCLCMCIYICICICIGDNEMDEETMMQEEQPVLTSVECVAFSPVKNLKLCASGGVDGTLKIWDYVAGVLRCECR